MHHEARLPPKNGFTIHDHKQDEQHTTFMEKALSDFLLFVPFQGPSTEFLSTFPTKGFTAFDPR